MVVCATPEALASAVCVFKCLLEAINPLMVSLHSGLVVCFSFATKVIDAEFSVAIRFQESLISCMR